MLAKMHDSDLGVLRFWKLIALIGICKMQTMWFLFACPQRIYANDCVYTDAST